MRILSLSHDGNNCNSHNVLLAIAILSELFIAIVVILVITLAVLGRYLEGYSRIVLSLPLHRVLATHVESLF